MTKALAVLALIGAAALPSVSNAQDVHQLPFASSDNTIELGVSNSSGIAASGITIRVSNIPSWLKFSAAEQRIAAIKANEEMPALFSFHSPWRKLLRSTKSMRSGSSFRLRLANAGRRRSRSLLLHRSGLSCSRITPIPSPPKADPPQAEIPPQLSALSKQPGEPEGV